MTGPTSPGIPAEWRGLLDPDERILWQGRPGSRLRWEFRSPIEPLFFVFFTGFSVIWMAMASRAGGFFWMFGLLFFVVGSYHLVGQHVWLAFVRSRTYYTLTSKRALIATDVHRRRTVQSYPINRGTVLNLVDDVQGSVYFAREVAGTDDGILTRKIGFELLADAREVLALMRLVQDGKA